MKHPAIPDDDDETPQADTSIKQALDVLITEILGPPEERRAPHSRCAPHVMMQRPQQPERPKLSSVVQSGIKKIRIGAILATKQAREETWRKETIQHE